MFTSRGKVVWGQPFSRYFVAVLAVWLGVLMTLCLGPALKDKVTFFFCAVMVSSWYGGLWPGLLTAFLSWLRSIIILLRPSFRWESQRKTCRTCWLSVPPLCLSVGSI